MKVKSIDECELFGSEAAHAGLFRDIFEDSGRWIWMLSFGVTSLYSCEDGHGIIFCLAILLSTESSRVFLNCAYALFSLVLQFI